MRKTIIHICLWAIALVGTTACNTEARFNSRGTELTFHVHDLMGTQVTVETTLKDDECYYYMNIISKEEYDKQNHPDKIFMSLMMDSLEVEYLEWKREYLKENVPYIASLRSHFFDYGGSTHFFVGLTPETDYYIYGFCVNPNTKEPVGKLYKQLVTTTALDTTTISPMVLDFRVEDMPEQGKTRITIRPSVDGKPYQEPFACIPTSVPERLIEEEYGGDIVRYADSIFAFMNEISIQEIFIKRDITTFEDYDLIPGERYILLAAAYRITYAQALYSLHYTFEPGMKLPYQHDPMPWEKEE